MRELLRTEWGLGPRLSDVFLGYYGGHVHMASEALTWLEKCLDDFDCEVVAPDGATGAIARCLEADDAAGSMRSMLTTLAQRGFAPLLHEGNACAQALSLANLGGVVKTNATTIVGLPPELRKGESYGMVPVSQFMVRFFPLLLPPSSHIFVSYPTTQPHIPFLLCTLPRNDMFAAPLDCQGTKQGKPQGPSGLERR